jgi:hypothetical protein
MNSEIAPQYPPNEAEASLDVASRSALFFDHSEHGSGPTRPYLDKVGRQWHVLDSMGDCVAACGFDENAARLIAALLNRERERINEPNDQGQTRSP